MPKRNIAWMLVIVLIALLFWKLPSTVARRDEVYRTLGTLVDIRREILRSYVEDVDEAELTRGAIEGMLHRLDHYSTYFPPELMSELKRATTGNYGGIGVEIGMKDGWLTVMTPMDDTPAFRAGLLAGDRIVEIEGKSTKGLSMQDAVKTLTGKPGTTVTITVKHEFENKVREITLARAVIKIVSVKGWERNATNGWDYMIDPDEKIGYVRIVKFMPGTVEALDKAVNQARSEGMKALILDLRWNPGGLLESAIGVTDRFLAGGVIVSTKGRWSQKKDSEAKREGTYPEFPLAVLVNGYSASAAEIVAGALRDHKRAVVIGARTFGKGSVQNVIRLEDGQGAIKLTTAYYYLPNGSCIHRSERADENAKWGVEPLIEVNLTKEERYKASISRYQADIIRPTTQPTTTQAIRPHPVIDRQLDQALNSLKAVLNVTAADRAIRKAG